MTVIQDTNTPVDNTVSEHFSFHISEPISALDLLHQQTDLSKQVLKESALKGAVWIQRLSTNKHSDKPKKPERLRRLKTPLKIGERLDLYYNPQLLQQTPCEPELIADMQSYSVWKKPRGMLSQGSKWADFTTLYRWVEINYKPDSQTRQCWIVHRLDKATCGLMLLAHSKKMASQLTQLFEKGLVEKTYQAWVHGEFPQATQEYHTEIDNKQAISHASRLNYNAELDISRVKVKIETGRKHQIRRHLSEAGFAIVGDRLYGANELDTKLNSKTANTHDLQLTAVKLCLPCPVENRERCFQLDNPQMDLIE